MNVHRARSSEARLDALSKSRSGKEIFLLPMTRRRNSVSYPHFKFFPMLLMSEPINDFEIRIWSIRLAKPTRQVHEICLAQVYEVTQTTIRLRISLIAGRSSVGRRPPPRPRGISAFKSQLQSSRFFSFSDEVLRNTKFPSQVCDKYGQSPAESI